jgi:hypothetical protein
MPPFFFAKKGFSPLERLPLLPGSACGFTTDFEKFWRYLHLIDAAIKDSTTNLCGM